MSDRELLDYLREQFALLHTKLDRIIAQLEQERDRPATSSARDIARRVFAATTADMPSEARRADADFERWLARAIALAVQETQAGGPAND